MSTRDERNHILHLVETGRVTAEQAGQLLDMLDLEQRESAERTRSVRVRVTKLPNSQQKVNVVLPVHLLHVGLRLATRLAPQVSGSALEDLLLAMASGATGRLLDLQDLEEGERVEIFAEEYR
jgi:hypothetical protein